MKEYIMEPHNEFTTKLNTIKETFRMYSTEIQAPFAKSISKYQDTSIASLRTYG